MAFGWNLLFLWIPVSAPFFQQGWQNVQKTKFLRVKEQSKIANVNQPLSLLSGCLLSQWTSQSICALRNKLVILRPETDFV